MKRSNRKRHRPEEVVAKLRQADEALPKGPPLTVASSIPTTSHSARRPSASFTGNSPLNSGMVQPTPGTPRTRCRSARRASPCRRRSTAKQDHSPAHRP